MEFPGLKSSCCSIHPSHVAPGLFCHISIIVALFRKELLSFRPQGNPQQPLSGKNSLCGSVAGRDGLAPKNGNGEMPVWAVHRNPMRLSSLVLHTRDNTAKARGCWRRCGVVDTRGLGLALWTKCICLPVLAHCAKSHFLWCSFSISMPGHMSDWCRNMEVWSEPLTLGTSGWGLLPFCRSSLSLFWSFLPFFLP